MKRLLSWSILAVFAVAVTVTTLVVAGSHEDMNPGRGKGRPGPPEAVCHIPRGNVAAARVIVVGARAVPVASGPRRRAPSTAIQSPVR